MSTVDSKDRKKALLVFDMEGAIYVLAKSRSKQKSHKNLNGAQEVYGMISKTVAFKRTLRSISLQKKPQCFVLSISQGFSNKRKRYGARTHPIIS